MSLSQFKVLLFDVYGTLVDWETGIYDALQDPRADLHLDQQWTKSDVLLAYLSVESELQAKKPTALYSDILAGAYDELFRRIRGEPCLPEASGNTLSPAVASTAGEGDANPEGTAASASGMISPVGASPSESGSGSSHAQPSSSAAAAFAASLVDWPVFPDTVSALAKLSSSHLGLKLAVLSNVDRASFAYTCAALERGFTFAAAYTAEEIGSYKPDPRNFEYAVTRLQADDPSLERDQILVVAQSLPHDHVPARALGLSSVWIDRPDSLTCHDGVGVPKTRTAKETFAKWRYRSLGEFASAIEGARIKSV
ncbi:HAD-like protein [Russula earlei]|uniref:HAD-like protein n=1 Tax=Russula earlei TaxID=71964 RepID=A0ACC0UH31_9AGAM|nr:HAD-like protein [Russula earlei]